MTKLLEDCKATEERVNKLSEESLKRALVEFISASAKDRDYFTRTFIDFEDYPGYKTSRFIGKSLELLLVQAEDYDEQLQYARRR